MHIINLYKYAYLLLMGIEASAYMGLAVAIAIVTAWLLSLIFLLGHPPTDSPIALVAEILLRTFLHTGLFVTAHDAIHGTIVPNEPVKNRWIGQIALGLYGFLPYKTCHRLHWQHHAHPAQPQDPDFYPKPDGHLIQYFIQWYCHFISNYLIWRNLGGIITGIGLTTLSLIVVADVLLQNIALFWVLPWILSSFQLFTFGIFLPHHTDSCREPLRDSPHQSRSYYYPIVLSFLTCYHFGYHREHHSHPNIPWYQLPNLALDDQ